MVRVTKGTLFALSMTSYGDGKYGPIRNWTRGCYTLRAGMGEIFIGKNVDNGQLFLIKSVAREPVWSKQLAALQNEERILRKLSTINCPNILRAVGNATSELVPEMGGKPTLDLFLEFALPRGNLTEIIQRTGKVKESVAKAYTFHILQALSCMHKNGIVHCDVKGLNIVLFERNVKLVGFGLAKDMSPRSTSTWTREPEVRSRPTEQAISPPPESYDDICALGLVVYEMVTGSRPTMDHSSQVDKVTRSLEEDVSLKSMSMCKSFIESCLRRGRAGTASTCHWTADRLLSHPWIASLEPFSPSDISSDDEYASTWRETPPLLSTDAMTAAASPRLTSLKICSDMLCCRTMDTDTVVPPLSSRSVYSDHRPRKKGHKLRRVLT